MSIHFDPLRALVRPIVQAPLYYDWSVQGFGMMRTYLDSDKVWRLNVWDSRLAVPNVSVIHDHPWDFESWVITGSFRNRRYRQTGWVAGFDGTAKYHSARIMTGPGGGMRGDERDVKLVSLGDELYSPGDVYQQRAEEIHESAYTDGTITLNRRIRRPDGDHARVYWPAGTNWVDAEPRAATGDEVQAVALLALEGFK